MIDDLDHPEFDPACEWPRRLLNVRNMTSHKWEPENTYGGISHPHYAVISYTWGRWRLRDQDSLEVDALQVAGIPWQVPKVDPSHFTATQFAQVLNLIADRSWMGSPFVWVDIACIPQFSPSAVANSEIGRQATIFRNAAADSYVWLTTAGSSARVLAETMGAEEPRPAAPELAAFHEILSDPWFGSMWTLQESFIMGLGAIIAGTELCIIPGDNKPFTLFALNELALIFQYDRSVEDHLYDEFEEKWSKTGLRGGGLGVSPMQVMACSSFRTCEYELDRVYGVMQIFGDKFRVGKARTNARLAAENTFTLAGLQNELGALVLQSYPDISQLFQHDTTPLAGRAWWICGKASVPREVTYASTEFTNQLSGRSSSTKSNVQCSLSTILEGGTTWAFFVSKTLDLRTLVKSFKAISFEPKQSSLNCWFDAGPLAPCKGSGKSQRTYDVEDIDPVVDKFGPDRLMLVLLSTQSSTYEDSKTSTLYGLLMLRPGEMALKNHRSRQGWNSSLDATGLRAWARVGICRLRWTEKVHFQYEATQEVQTMLGLSGEWRNEEGLWG